MDSFFTDSVFMGVVISLLTYELGLWIKKKVKFAIFNPLLSGHCRDGIPRCLSCGLQRVCGGSEVYQLSAYTGNRLPGSSAL